jgi:hypothetical protein
VAIPDTNVPILGGVSEQGSQPADNYMIKHTIHNKKFCNHPMENWNFWG